MSAGWINRPTKLAISRPIRRPNRAWRRQPRSIIMGGHAMERKMKELADLYQARQIGRRELMRRAGRLGLSAAAASVLFNRVTTRALAADFDWKASKGKTLSLLLNKHPYADAMIADLPNFKELTGLEVKYDVFPEDVYFDKVTAALSSKGGQYDAFMTGAYQTWQYGPAGWLVDMSEYIKDPAKT